MCGYPKQRQTLASSMIAAVFLKSRTATLQNVYWWWYHSLSQHVIGRFFPQKHSCESTPGPRKNCQALTSPRLQKGWGPLP